MPEQLMAPRAVARGPRRISRSLAIVALVAVCLTPQVSDPAPAAAITTATTATVGPFTFEIGQFDLNRLPIEELTDYGDTVVTCPNTDGQGVPMYRAPDGQIHNHPVAQARCAAYMMRNFWLTDDPVYMERAINNAERILSYAETHGTALFFPYSFNLNNPGRSRLTAPWYSAMAQGLGLSAFVRLYEWTGDVKWLQAAHKTFASFKFARAPGVPWVVGVESRLLWLDEYPTVPLDRVFNGHNFSTFGLYDYWRVTDNAEARLLALGAMHSAYTVGANAVRIPGGISQYCASQACLTNRVRNPSYHVTHINQMLSMHRMTQHRQFASLAEALIADSPRPYPGRVSLAAGRHTGYSFDASTEGVPVTSVTLATSTTLTFNRRDVPAGRYSPGNGIWMRISEGPLSGLWVRESSRAVPLGFTDVLDFYWARPVRVEAGSYVGKAFDAAAQPTASVQVSTSGASWSYTSYRRINGIPSVFLASGPLTGHWLALDTRTIRDSTLFADVDASPFRSDIIWLTTKEITRGCATFRYCPTASVTREQMASFLARSMQLPAARRDHFTDDEGRSAENDINRVADARITVGCATNRFCPTHGVTRAQMASFLARALDLPAARRDYFADDSTSPHQGDINRLAEAGITGGCGDRRYCPGASVTRGQMAAFLHRAFANHATTASLDAERAAPPDASPSPTPVPAQTGEPSASPSPSPSVPAETAPPESPTSEPSPSPTDTTPPDASPSPSPSSTEPVP